MKIPVKELAKIRQTADLLYSSGEIEAAIVDLAAKLNAKHCDDNPLCLNILNGATPFFGRLLQQLDFPLQTDYIHASRYQDELSGSQLQIYARPQTALTGRNVWLIDDIFDEGITLTSIAEWALEQGAATVKTIVLTEKLHTRKSTLPSGLQTPDHIALTVPDRYVFGWGMDYKSYWRNLDAIYALPDEK